MKITKKELTERCKRILHKYPLNSFISEQPDFEFLIDVFSNHHEWTIKKGNGVRSIQILLSEYKNRHFQLHRIDGTQTDISYLMAIKGKQVPAEQTIRCACRTAIRPIIKQLRDQVNIGTDRCQLSGELLTTDNLHIDHHNLTFDELFKIWIQKYSPTELLNEINDTTADNETNYYFINSAIEQDFINFHNSNTNLRPVTRTANLKSK